MSVTNYIRPRGGTKTQLLWGDFYRLIFSIKRSFPHTIVDIQRESIIPSDCGLMF
jgi:hypothetical protein